MDYLPSTSRIFKFSVVINAIRVSWVSLSHDLLLVAFHFLLRNVLGHSPSKLFVDLHICNQRKFKIRKCAPIVLPYAESLFICDLGNNTLGKRILGGDDK